MKLSRAWACGGLFAALPGLAAAADIDGAALSVLWGVPFAVKDNIDVAGMPTTAASTPAALAAARIDAASLTATR